MRLGATIRSLAKSAVAQAMYASGLLGWIARRRLSGRAVVLMYHRVLPEAAARKSFSHPGMIVTPETFRRQMDFLRRHFAPMTMDRFVSHLQEKRPFPPGACLVSFDDGWQDNYEHALPILRDAGVPAVLFVATGYVGTDDCFWQERLGRLLSVAATHGSADEVLRGHGIDLGDGGTVEALRRTVAQVVDRYRREPYESIESLLYDLDHALCGQDRTDPALAIDRFVDWEQLEGMGANGVSIASHTRSHRYLPRLAPDVVEQELRESRVELDQRLAQQTLAVAYPGGRHDDATRVAVLKCGYRLGFTTEQGFVGHDGDPTRIPRINVHEGATHSIPLFLSRMINLF